MSTSLPTPEKWLQPHRAQEWPPKGGRTSLQEPPVLAGTSCPFWLITWSLRLNQQSAGNQRAVLCFLHRCRQCCASDSLDIALFMGLWSADRPTPHPNPWTCGYVPSRGQRTLGKRLRPETSGWDCVPDGPEGLNCDTDPSRQGGVSPLQKGVREAGW